MSKPLLHTFKPMPASRLSTRTPIIIGHRGAMGVAPENTLPAFEAALAANADGVEFDVQRTTDGHLVIFHDEDVARTTDGEGMMPQMSLAELQALDLGVKFDPRFAGTRILTLDAFFAWCKGNDLLLFLELKEPFHFPGIEPQVVDAIRRHDLVERVQVRSFFHEHLHTLHGLAPELSISELWRSHLPAPEELTYRTLNIRSGFYTQAAIQQFKALGHTVTAWVVDDVDEAQRLVEWGIDGLTSNDPAGLIAALGL